MLESGGQTGSDELTSLLENHLLEAGRMILMLDNSDNPKFVSRAWCLFETFVSIDKKLPVSIILPQMSRSQIRVRDTRSDKLRDALGGLDVRHARASNKLDEDKIKRLILTSVGADLVNQSIRDYLLDSRSRFALRKFL